MIEPRLRFKADDGSDFPDWEEKRLEDVVEFLDEKRKPLEAGKRVAGKYPYYGASGIIDYVEDYIFDEELILLSEDGANILDRNYRVCFLAKGKYWVNNHAHVMKAKKGNLNYFICEELETFDYRKYNSGGAQPKLNQASCRSIVVKIPSLPEQQKIADFLSTIDTIIEKQRATVSAWEERKKGVMQKLFSQEVRFKADDGSDFPDWEEKSFVNTFDSLNNSTFSRDCLNYENGSVKYIHYGDILVKYNSSVDVCDAIVPFVNEDLDCERFAILQDGDIVIADTAEDDTVGKVIEIENTSNVKTIAGLHTIACRPKEKFASKYLGYYMNSDEYHNQLRPYMQGIKVTSISKSNIALTKIMVPSLPEQQKIVDCLSALDAVIEKQKETLEKWQELKKGLLQQMFV